MVKEFRRVAQGDTALALLDGWHLVHDAVEADIAIKTLAVTREAMAGDIGSVLSRAERRGADIVEVSAAVANALSPVRTPSGIVALIERRSSPLSALLQPPPALLVVAVDMQDPGNVGAIIRSAEAGGASGVAFVGASSDPWSWKALRAAMGSTLRLPVLQTADPAAVFAALKRAELTIAAAVPNGGTAMHEANLCQPVALVMGGEGGGLSSAIIDGADLRVSVPMRAPVESLNAAVAAALLVYEAARQREEGV